MLYSSCCRHKDVRTNAKNNEIRLWTSGNQRLLWLCNHMCTVFTHAMLSGHSPTHLQAAAVLA